MPYYLAPLWDVHYAHIDRDSSRRRKDGLHDVKHRVPKDLRIKLKHARAARGMLQDLEQDIREFIQRWNEKQLKLEEDVLFPDDDSEDEIVFVGRNGQMHDSPSRRDRLNPAQSDLHERDGEKMVLESAIDDRAAGFG